jgi:acetoacetyl-CoA synthetase
MTGPIGPLWVPSKERAAASAMARLVAWAGQPDSTALQRWSVSDLGAFWSLLWEVAGVRGESGDEVYVPAARLGDERFFPSARLNRIPGRFALAWWVLGGT